MILYLTSVNEFTTDADALDRCLFGVAHRETEALAELYRRTSVSVYAFALTILKNVHDAEDALHDCYISVYDAASSYRSVGKPMAWLLRIARNLCLMKIRDRRKTADVAEEDWERHMEGNAALAAEDRQLLSECMARLSDAEQQITVLHAVAGLKHREIAELLDLPLPTVLSKYARALQKLKRMMLKGEREG